MTAKANLPPNLSICIPTFNRSTILLPLLKEILSVPGDFEVSIHIDGSTDNTSDELSRITDQRLSFSSSMNSGRASALRSAIINARGTFVMPFDDDDELDPDGLKIILEDCKNSIGKEYTGFIYHLDLPPKDLEVHQRASRPKDFPVLSTNLLALRADFKIAGDKKEVVKREHFIEAIEQVPLISRRIPTSLYWAKISLNHDIICRNVIVGKKNYLDQGMSRNIYKLKRESPEPMILLHQTIMKAFLAKRYRSFRFFFRSAAAYIAYSILRASKRLKIT